MKSRVRASDSDSVGGCKIIIIIRSIDSRASHGRATRRSLVRSCGRAVEHARVDSGDASRGNVERARGSRANRNDDADEANGRGGDDDDDA